MIDWLKWKIAGKEMLELERWRVGCQDAERWLGEFSNVTATLKNLRHSVSGNETYYDMPGLRDKLRAMESIKAPNTLHPTIQSIISRDARKSIELNMIERMIDEPDFEYYGSDYDYQTNLTDKVEAFVKAARGVK